MAVSKPCALTEPNDWLTFEASCENDNGSTLKVDLNSLKMLKNHSDIILVGLRDYQDAKADVIMKYNSDEARRLKNMGHLPESVNVISSPISLKSSNHL